MYDTTIAAKLLKQLKSFLGKISPRFHKPVVRFIGDMIYGIMVEKDVKLSSIVRALREMECFVKARDGNRAKNASSAAGNATSCAGCSPGNAGCATGSFRIHDVPELHFHAIADGAGDVLKRGRRWRGFDPEKVAGSDVPSLFAFFGMNTG